MPNVTGPASGVISPSTTPNILPEPPREPAAKARYHARTARTREQFAALMLEAAIDQRAGGEGHEPIPRDWEAADWQLRVAQAASLDAIANALTGLALVETGAVAASAVRRVAIITDQVSRSPQSRPRHPDVETVRRVIESSWSDECGYDLAAAADAILDLLPERTEAEVKVEALREAIGSSPSEAVFDVLLERRRQDIKWGEQNHPDGTGPMIELPSLAGDTARDQADDARDLCEIAFLAGEGTWLDILREEVAEAFAAAGGKLRDELVQVAAVAVAWIEAIDRRRP